MATIQKLTAEQQVDRELLIAEHQLRFRISLRTRKQLAAMAARRGWRP